MSAARISLFVALALTATACKSRPNSTSGESTGESRSPSTPSTSAPAAATPPAEPPMPGAIPAPSDVAAPPADAQRTASGLSSKVLVPGSGTEHPSATSTVRVHYTGWTTDGRMFDSSVSRGQPATFPLNGVIPGWTEGVQLMVLGEKRRFWIPVELAYNNRPGMPAGMLVFDVELLGIMAPPATPEDVAAAPRTARCESNHLCSRVITPGRGGPKPSATDWVSVDLDGWTSDGELFDSTSMRGQPARFPLDRMTVPGLAQGIRLMTVGEKRRLWLPAAIAFAGNPRAPQGDVVFDVTLVSIDQPPPGMPGAPGQPAGTDEHGH